MAAVGRGHVAWRSEPAPGAGAAGHVGEGGGRATSRGTASARAGVARAGVATGRQPARPGGAASPQEGATARALAEDEDSPLWQARDRVDPRVDAGGACGADGSFTPAGAASFFPLRMILRAPDAGAPRAGGATSGPLGTWRPRTGRSRGPGFGTFPDIVAALWSARTQWGPRAVQRAGQSWLRGQEEQEVTGRREERGVWQSSCQ